MALCIAECQLSWKGLNERKHRKQSGPTGEENTATYLTCYPSGQLHWVLTQEESLQGSGTSEWQSVAFSRVVEAMPEGAGLDSCILVLDLGRGQLWRACPPGHSPAGVCNLLPFPLLHHPPPEAQGRSGHRLAQRAADQL